MVKKLLHTRYRVQDLEKTVSFYKDVLGLKELRRHTSGRGSQLVFLKAPHGDEEIEICKFDESGPIVVGPDLTHLMTRKTIASGMVDNNTSDLRKWVDDPQTTKPGCLMPAMKLSARDVDLVVRYLESLR